ncbi:MAG: hypothetical protein ACTS3T_11090, partial [Almyronema sp.]
MTSVQSGVSDTLLKTTSQIGRLLCALVSMSIALPAAASIGSLNSFDQQVPLEPAIAPESNVIQLAQVEQTLIFFETDDYAVRVLSRGDEGLFMNVFNQRTGIQEQNGVPATALPRRDGEPLSYLSSS